MPTPKKTEQVARIRQMMEQSGSVFFADFSRLGASEMSSLRRQLRKENIRLLVAKNRLIRRALLSLSTEVDFTGIMRGPTSLILGPAAEPYGPGRRLKELLDRFRQCQFKGAYTEQMLYPAGQFEVLAAMPTRSELRTQLVGVLMSPLQQLTAVLEGLTSSLVFLLEELRNRREDGLDRPGCQEPPGGEQKTESME